MTLGGFYVRANGTRPYPNVSLLKDRETNLSLFLSLINCSFLLLSKCEQESVGASSDPGVDPLPQDNVWDGPYAITSFGELKILA